MLGVAEVTRAVNLLQPFATGPDGKAQDDNWRCSILPLRYIDVQRVERPRVDFVRYRPSRLKMFIAKHGHY